MNSSQILELQKKWFSLQPLTPECKKRLREKFRLEFNYNSNHLEGNTLTYGETKLLILFDETKGNHEFREYAEMKAHDVALAMVEDEAQEKERPLTETFIRRLNEIILVAPFWKEAETADGQATRKLISVGEYKTAPNHVRLANGEIFEYASPEETPALMADLVQWFRSEEEKAELQPIELAALLHYKYIRIHPFDDGNGRVARLLVNYVMQKNNLPPLVIKTDDKKNYLRALHQADAGDINAFVDYMKKQLLWSLDISIRAAQGEDIEEPDDWEKKLSLLKKEMGGNADKTVTIKYSHEVIINILEEEILPLVNIIDEKLKKTDSILLSRNINFSMGNDWDVSNFSSFGQKSIPKDLRDLNVWLVSDGIIKIESEPFELDFFDVHFYENAYEIDTPNMFYSKLYNEKLSEEEIDTIVSDIGSRLVEEIEIQMKLIK